MTSQDRPQGTKPELIDVIFEVPPSLGGAYQREREDGTIVHGDASGEWALDGEREIDDIVYFASPLWLRRGREI
jgi:hypothetical protein